MIGQGKIIAIIGNCGSGKTTLAQILSRRLGYRLLLEQHEERPYQRAFMLDRQAGGLPNQVDYLLLRAEQEQELRRSPGVGVVDGGLDQDFYIFTRLFHLKGYLTGVDFQLCERLHRLLRQLLPSPDLTIRLKAPLDVLRARRDQRARPLDIVTADDLVEIETLLAEWMRIDPPAPVLEVESRPEAFYDPGLDDLLNLVQGAANQAYNSKP
jgi:deoxyadenosine/deoxycytidine kinase